MALSWTCCFVFRAHFRVRLHTQLNINEGVSTAGKARPGGTAIYGFKAIGQPSDIVFRHAGGRGVCKSFVGEDREGDPSS